MEHPQELRKFYKLAFEKRPATELYDLIKDPGQIKNITDSPEYSTIKDQLDQQLRDHLTNTGDPRIIGGKALWDYYPYYGAYNQKKTRKKQWTVAPFRK